MPKVAYRAVRGRRVFLEASEVVPERLADFIDDTVKPHYIQRFELVVENWKHKPDFRARMLIRPDGITLYVFPTGPDAQIYKWVTEGTEGGYKIPKAGPGYLAFQLGYKPKTKPPGKIGGPGIYSGPWVRGVMQVTHPGIDPRNFEAVIAEDEAPWFSREMENAWRRIIREL